MKFFIVFSAALIACVNCVPVVNTGNSAVSRSEDGYGNYAFGYNEDHATGGTFRKEKGSHGVQTGSYGLRDADGRMRVVSYVADALGFRASVQTNEPGVDPHQVPAATTLNGAAPVVPVPVHGYAAPLAVGHGYAAPVAVGHGYAAPLAYAAPIASSYSVSTQHVAAPLAVGHGLAAPLAVGHGLGYGYAGKY